LALALIVRGAAALPGWAAAPAASWAVATFLPVLALAGGTAWLAGRGREFLPLRVRRGQPALFCLGALGLGLAGGLAVGATPVRLLVPQGMTGGWTVIWAFGWVAVVVPLVEEAYFRGALLGAVGAAWGAVLGVVLSALAFGLAHLGSPEALMWVGVGVALGTLRQVSGSLLPPVALHLAWNVASLALALQPRLGPVALPATGLGAALLGAGAWWPRQKGRCR
jgi:membrane protease YdiL (CAAX protease family)